LALLCNGFAAPNVPNAKNPEWKFFSLLLDFFRGGVAFFLAFKKE